jgi:hypothetical protein
MADDYGLREMIPEELQEQLNKIADAFQKFGVELSKAIAPTVEALINLFNLYIKICIENADPKLKHLALHSKKARVRNKNLNRIIKEATKRCIS